MGEGRELSNICTETSETCTRYRQKQRSNDWITPRKWKMISSRGDAKKKSKAKSLRLKERHEKEHSEIQKEVRKDLCTD